MINALYSALKCSTNGTTVVASMAPLLHPANSHNAIHLFKVKTKAMQLYSCDAATMMMIEFCAPYQFTAP